MLRNLTILGILQLLLTLSSSALACISNLQDAVKSRAVYNLPVPFFQLCPELQNQILEDYNFNAIMPIFTVNAQKPPVATASFLGFTETGQAVFVVSAHVTRSADVDFVIAGTLQGESRRIFLQRKPIFTSQRGDLSVVIADSEKTASADWEFLRNISPLSLNGESTVNALAHISQQTPPLLLGWANYDAFMNGIKTQPEYWQQTEAEKVWSRQAPISIPIDDAVNNVSRNIRVTPIINVAKILAGGISGLQYDGDGLLIGTAENRGSYLIESEKVQSQVIAYNGRSGGGMSGSPLVSGKTIYITHGTKGNPPMIKNADGKHIPNFELLAAREDLIELLHAVLIQGNSLGLLPKIENIERRFQNLQRKYQGQDSLAHPQAELFESLLKGGHTLQTQMNMVNELLEKLLRGEILNTNNKLSLTAEFSWAYGNPSYTVIQDMKALNGLSEHLDPNETKEVDPTQTKAAIEVLNWIITQSAQSCGSLLSQKIELKIDQVHHR